LKSNDKKEKIEKKKNIYRGKDIIVGVGEIFS
jgi:hypothetical protein